MWWINIFNTPYIAGSTDLYSIYSAVMLYSSSIQLCCVSLLFFAYVPLTVFILSTLCYVLYYFPFFLLPAVANKDYQEVQFSLSHVASIAGLVSVSSARQRLTLLDHRHVATDVQTSRGVPVYVVRPSVKLIYRVKADRCCIIGVGERIWRRGRRAQQNVEVDVGWSCVPDIVDTAAWRSSVCVIPDVVNTAAWRSSVCVVPDIVNTAGWRSSVNVVPDVVDTAASTSSAGVVPDIVNTAAWRSCLCRSHGTGSLPALRRYWWSVRRPQSGVRRPWGPLGLSNPLRRTVRYAAV